MESYDHSADIIQPLKSERLLIERALPSFDRALVISPGRAQLAFHLARQVAAAQSNAKVDAWFFDLFPAELVRAGNAVHAQNGPNIVCSPDLPQHDYQLIAIPLLARGEAELARDLMQQAHQRLVIGGTLVVSVDNEKDSWLLEQMQEILKSVSVARGAGGSVYWSRKTAPLKRVRDFTCQFAFRDQEQLIQVISEPGVFAHRRLDPGARQLLNACEIEEGDRVLDLGCGSGSVALAAAFQTTADVWAVDCNTRAIRCTEKGAQLNQLSNVKTLLNADGKLEMNNQFELVLANPPYYSDHTISRRFVDMAWDALIVGGALITVTKPKQAGWFESYYQSRDMEDIVSFNSSDYAIVCCRKSW